MKIGAPHEVWCKGLFELEGSASFIPVQRIYSKFIPAYDTVDREQVLVVCQIPRSNAKSKVMKWSQVPFGACTVL